MTAQETRRKELSAAHGPGDPHRYQPSKAEHVDATPDEPPSSNPSGSFTPRFLTGIVSI